MKSLRSWIFTILVTAFPVLSQEGDPSFDSSSTMDEGSGTIDSTGRGTSTSPGSSATTTPDEKQRMEDSLETEEGTGIGEDAPVGTGPATPTEDWEEEE
jgi:hypothetical protein